MNDQTRTVRGIQERLRDADALWQAGRRDSALLLALVALAARARLDYPALGDRAAFLAYTRSRHGWRISIEHRGQQVGLDELLYTWLRCSLVHEAALPVDISIDDEALLAAGMALRAGGAPDYHVLIGTGWYDFIREAALSDLSD